MPTRRNRLKKQRGGASTLPTTSWGSWSAYPGALAWGNGATAPPPLANGGLYTGPQSTGAWASAPFPATLYGWQVAAAQTAGNPDVFYHQRPNDNTGASFSPYVGTPISPLNTEPMYKAVTQSGGRTPVGIANRGYIPLFALRKEGRHRSSSKTTKNRKHR